MKIIAKIIFIGIVFFPLFIFLFFNNHIRDYFYFIENKSGGDYFYFYLNNLKNYWSKVLAFCNFKDERVFLLFIVLTSPGIKVTSTQVSGLLTCFRAVSLGCYKDQQQQVTTYKSTTTTMSLLLTSSSTLQQQQQQRIQLRRKK